MYSAVSFRLSTYNWLATQAGVVIQCIIME